MNLLVHLCQNNVTKTETIIIDEILNTVPNVGFKSPFLSSRIVNFTPRLKIFERHESWSSQGHSDIFSKSGYFFSKMDIFFVLKSLNVVSHRLQGHSVKFGYFFHAWIFYPAD